MRQCFRSYGIVCVLLTAFLAPVHASEVFESKNIRVSEAVDQTGTQVIVREHPKTGRPYVSIVSSELSNPPDPFRGQRSRYSRPDYRMLDPKIKSGKIPYEGPYSDRKKVYIFAASLATLGVAGGAVGMATASTAAAGTTAATGGAGYVAAGSALAGTATAAAVIKSQPNPQKDPYRHSSESTLLETKRS